MQKMKVDGHKLHVFGTFRQFLALLGTFDEKSDEVKLAKNP